MYKSTIIVTLVMTLSFSPVVYAANADIQMLIQLYGSETKAFSSTRTSALENIPHSQYFLGLMYFEGAGTSVNNDEGVKWLKKSATNGDVDAQRVLGIIYVYGELVPSNFSESVKWSTLATEQLEPTSTDLLGMLYENGRGVKKDLVKAFAFYNLAASLGNNNAATHRSELTPKLTNKQVTNAQKLSNNLRSQYIEKLKIKEEARFSKEPIDINTNKLPSNYQGNNYSKICNILYDKKQSLVKGKLESETMYVNRINKLSNNNIVDNLKIGSLIAIKDELIDPLGIDSKYNESKNTIDISLGCANSPNSNGIQMAGPEIDIPNTYSKITISMKEEFSDTTISGYRNSILYINKNKTDTEIVDYPRIKNVPTRKIRVKVNPQLMEQIANNKYGLLYISKIIPPFSFIHKNNKLDEKPINITTENYLVLDVVQFWIYNLKTGEVIAKIDN